MQNWISLVFCYFVKGVDEDLEFGCKIGFVVMMVNLRMGSIVSKRRFGIVSRNLDGLFRSIFVLMKMQKVYCVVIGLYLVVYL